MCEGGTEEERERNKVATLLLISVVLFNLFVCLSISEFVWHNNNDEMMLIDTR